MADRLRVAAVQMDSGEKREKNLERACSFILEAVELGARVVAFPEAFDYRGCRKNYWRVAEYVPGDVINTLARMAADNRVYILCGTVVERPADGGLFDPQQQRYYNTSVLLSPDGGMLAVYRKIHLFDLYGANPIRESESFMAGRTVRVAEIDGHLCGLAVCYDLRFPELFRRFAEARAELIFVPSNFTYLTGSAHWEVLNRARAIENQAFIVAPNQSGSNTATGTRSYGNTMIVGPWGKVLSRAPAEGESVVVADLDFEYLATVRSELPALNHIVAVPPLSSGD